MGRSKSFHPPYEIDDLYVLQMDPDEAISKIMDAYGDEIKRLVFTYMKNSADTDDVTQEVFVTVYKKLHTFQGKSTLKSWIYSIAVNKCKDYLRSWQARNKRLKEKLIQSAQRDEPPIEIETPEEQMIKQNEANSLLTQVMELPVRYREIIILFYFKDLSTKEISNVLDMKEATVRTRLNRGREKLKKCISEERGGVDHG